MTKRLNLSEVRRCLSGLVDEVTEEGVEIVITRRGKAVAKMTKATDESSNPYPLRGLGIWIADDFDEPMHQFWGDLGEDIDHS